jgi:hypothetical protein
MARLTLLLMLLVLALPATAFAGSREAALATERYYSSYGTDPAPLVTATPAATSHDGPSWLGAAAIGAGLVLLAGGLGAYAARTVRPRGVRA